MNGKKSLPRSSERGERGEKERKKKQEDKRGECHKKVIEAVGLVTLHQLKQYKNGTDPHPRDK